MKDKLSINGPALFDDIDDTDDTDDLNNDLTSARCVPILAPSLSSPQDKL